MRGVDREETLAIILNGRKGGREMRKVKSLEGKRRIIYEGDKTKSELTLRQKTLLLFLGFSDLQELDPIRIMKGLFLIAMEAPKKWLPREARYKFEPYDWGPYSVDIYSDLDQLIEYKYIKTIEIPDHSWKYYSLTSMGIKISKSVAKDMDPRMVKYLQTIREFVDSLSFHELLTAIYRQYPKYAVNSVF